MKTLLIGLSLAFSLSSFANNCEEKVLADYIKATPGNEFHRLSSGAILVGKSQAAFKYYDSEIALGYNFDVEIYIASSEYMGGFGMEALVVKPTTCETLQMENVYRE